MQKLFAFIFKYRVFFVFMGVEFFCLYLIFSKNNYQKTTFLNSSSSIVGNFVDKKQSVKDYFNLTETNRILAAENARLKEIVIRSNALSSFTSGSLSKQELDKYRVYSAKVVNNSINLQNNYITLNIGKLSGLEKGMGVVTDNGVVGTIISCSDRYSLVASVLHSKTMISAKIKKTGTIGSVTWPGADVSTFSLKHIPRHVRFDIGDTVVTSGYNSVFPENTLVGIITESTLSKNGSFHEINIRMIENLTDLNYVYIIENINKVEQQNLENVIE